MKPENEILNDENIDLSFGDMDQIQINPINSTLKMIENWNQIR